MTNIRGNHVALVERGRIGRVALVADSLPKLMEFNMKLKKGALAKINATAKSILKAKGLAADADLTPEEIKELVTAVVENTEHVVEDNEEVEKMVGAEDEDETETAEDEDDGEKADKERKELEKTDKDDSEAKKEAAMDADAIRASAVKDVTELFEARELVKPLVGVVAMDSAIDVYKHALKKSGVDTTGVNTVSGLKSMVNLVAKQKAQPQPKAAMDSASYEDDPLTARFK